MDKWNKSEYKEPKDGEDKGKKREKKKNKNLILGLQAAPEHAVLNQAI